MSNRHKDAKEGTNSGREYVAIVKVKPLNVRSKYWNDY